MKRLAWKPPAPHRSTERGFVLLGVIVFVLALTILGLSLFSLSSYEAQFFGQSANQTQAFYDASGGIERAKYLLTQTSTLESVANGLGYDGPEGVTYARAVQNGVSTGGVAWSPSQPITIRVLAVRHGQKRMLEQSFRPQADENFYKRFGTFRDGILLNLVGGPGPTARTKPFVTGTIYQSSSDTSWTNGLPYLGPRPVYVRPNIPLPDLDPYWAQHWATAVPPVNPGGSHSFHFNTGAPGSVTYFKTAHTSGDYSVEIVSGSATDLHVDGPGMAVWMLDQGIRSNTIVTVDGTGQCLVVVAKPGDPATGYDAGVWFFGGIQSTIPVIFVTNGEIRLEQFYGENDDDFMPYVSMFARRLFLMGPRSPHSLQLTHFVSSLFDQPNALIDQLYSLGALPSTNISVAPRFSRVSGSWAELDPDNPPN